MLTAKSRLCKNPLYIFEQGVNGIFQNQKMQRRKEEDLSDEEEDTKPRQSARLTAIKESQESQESLRSHQSHTGLSQDFEDVEITNLTPPSSPSARVIDTSIPALSYAVLCLANRPSTNKRQKPVEVFALQNTFFAYPTETPRPVLQTINDKIGEITDDFIVQGYTIDKKVFPLPFAVEQICRVSTGYTMTAKKLKAPKAGKKRKHHSSDEEEEDSSADEDASRDDASRDDASNDDASRDDGFESSTTISVATAPVSASATTARTKAMATAKKAKKI